jgi:mannose-6-phosphate isomerase-like protein (cupin superfamily)
MNEALRIADATVRVLVSSKESVGSYTICQVETNSSGGPPLHKHGYEDGFFYILEGDFQFQIGDRQQAAPKGTSLFIPRRTPYAFHNRAPGIGRFLLLSQPGGMDLFFQDVNAASRGRTDIDWTSLASILGSVLEKHGISIAKEQ